MLGLLPSDQFQVLIEALWKPLSKLLVSSLMTGLVFFLNSFCMSLVRFLCTLFRHIKLYDLSDLRRVKDNVACPNNYKRLPIG